MQKLLQDVQALFSVRRVRAAAAIRQAAGAVVQPLESRQLLDAVVDLRLVGGGQSAEISSNGQVVEMEVWATVTGNNATGDDETLRVLAGSFLSNDRNGGAVRGKLTATVNPNFGFNGSWRGSNADLDADGDLDVGSNNNASSSGFFAARTELQPHQIPSQSVPNGKAFLVGTVRFTTEELLPGETTRIVFRPRGGGGIKHVWVEDGQVQTNETSEIRAGAWVSLKLADGTHPQPGDTVAPTATLNADDVSSAGADAYTFKVRYADNQQIRVSSLGTGDIRVTGPGGFSQVADFLSSDNNNDGSVTATYRITPPGGSWNSADNGTYTVAVQANQVFDPADNAVAAGNLGSFQVNIAPPKPSVPAKLSNGTLTITGGQGADEILVATVKSNVRVTFNGTSENFAGKDVKKIVVNAGAGDDVVAINAGSRSSVIDGGNGNDSLTGGAGRDSLFGGSGADRLLGGDNNDLLLGMAGDDSIDGQAGNDKFDGGSGNDAMNGGSGSDTVDYSSRKVAMTISLDGKANDGLKGEKDNVGTDVEQVLGGRSHDLIIGNGANNRLVGNAGNDTIRGGGGNDTLVGSAGVDQLFGEAGNDFFDARDGTRDLLDGGEGNDSAKADGNDQRKSVEKLV